MSSSDQRTDEPQPESVSLAGFTLGRSLRILLVTAAVLAVTSAVLLVVPRSYESSATILYAEPGSATPGRGADDLNAVMTARAELLTAPDLLKDVASETGVPDLSGQVRVERESGSALLTVVASSSDAALAARIANAVAKAHINRSAVQAVTDAADSNAWLQGEIDKLREGVAAADAALADYQAEHGLAATAATGSDTGGIAANIADAMQRSDAAEAGVRKIRDLLASGGPMDGVAELQASAGVQRLLADRAGLAAELTQKSTTLLANHPTIRALNSQIDALDVQIAIEAEKVAAALDAEAQTEETREQGLRDELARTQLRGSADNEAGATLAALEREAATQRELLDGYLTRAAEAALTGTVTAPQPEVRLVAEAVPATAPTFPNVPLILGSVGLAALVLQAGAVLLSDVKAGRTRRAVTDEADADARFERAEQDRLFEDAELAAFGDPDETDIDAATAEPEIAEFADEPEFPGFAQPEIAAPVATSDELSALSAAVTDRQLRVLLLASLGPRASLVGTVAHLLDDALGAGLSAVVLDVGSGMVSTRPGITDLAAGEADYGEVLQLAGDNIAEVKWGRQAALDLSSTRPLMLIEALADIYHVVIVDTGRAGTASNLPLFANAKGSVVLVADEAEGPVTIGQARREIAALGFAVDRVVTLPSVQADVA
ncbi:MAG: GumC family protein [Devosia sp.]